MTLDIAVIFASLVDVIIHGYFRFLTVNSGMLWVGAVGKADGDVGAGKRSKRSRQIKDRPGEMLGTGAWLEVGRLAGDWGKRRAARVAGHSVDVGLFVQQAHLPG